MTRRADDRREPKRRRWIVWSLVLLAVIGPIYARALLQARAELQRGHDLLDVDPARAITAYRHAVEWYAPGNPFSAAAANALFEIGTAEPGGERDPSLTLRALESLRTAILVTRTIYTPYGDRLPTVERRIAELRGLDAASRTGAAPDAEIARQLELLRMSRERAPHPIGSLVTTAAFVLWIAATALFIRSAFGDARHRRRRSVVLGCTALAGLATWIVGLLLV